MEENKEEKIERPKPKLRTSPLLRKIGSELIAVNKELRELIVNYNKHKNYPESKDFKKALKAYDKKPALEDKFKQLISDHNKERFKQAYGDELNDIERAAIVERNKNAWLKLLRWSIDYLENKQLRAMIYKAHKEKDINFLKEVAHIIGTPLKPHGNVNNKLWDLLFKLFDEGRTKKDVIQEVYNQLDYTTIDYKQLKDMGF